MRTSAALLRSASASMVNSPLFYFGIRGRSRDPAMVLGRTGEPKLATRARVQQWKLLADALCRLRGKGVPEPGLRHPAIDLPCAVQRQRRRHCNKAWACISRPAFQAIGLERV